MSTPANSSPQEARDNTPTALLLESDLFFRVKVTETLRHSGYATLAARTLADFTARLASDAPTLALVNTAIRGGGWREAIVAAREAGVPVIAFGPHVDLGTQEAARQAGATRVISNSKLASDLPGIVARTLRGQSADTPEVSRGTMAADESDDDM